MRSNWHRAAWRAVWLQLGIILAAGAGFLPIGQPEALAVILGGMGSWLPNAWFSARAVLLENARDPGARVRQLYVAEAVKLALSMVLLALVFSRIRSALAGIVLGSFVVAHMTYLILLASMYRGHSRI